MKYILLFLPIFSFAQGVDSTLYSVRIDSAYVADHSTTYQQLYFEGRSFELVDSFRYNGAYYELRENGWYKQIIPDTLPRYGAGKQIIDTCWQVMGNLRILKPGCLESIRWTTSPPCDQHFGEVDHPKRDKIEQSEVKLLVWNGCTLSELKATKFIGYNYSDNSFWVDDTVSVKDFIIWYLAEDKWIKSSYVIKEL